MSFNVQAFLEKPLNRFMGAGGTGMRIADFEGDVLDQSNLPFIRGGIIQGNGVGYQPIAVFGSVPRSVKSRWGAEWKKAAVEYYDRTGLVAFSGEQIPHKGNYFDLDPTYKDHAGDPLLRMTMNWHENERKMVEFMNAKMVEIAHAMGAKEVNPSAGYGKYDVARYQSTHVQGGTMMAPSPDRGVVNTHLQHWQVPNLFVLGGSTMPNTGSANPTPTILALTYRTAILHRGPLFEKSGDVGVTGISHESAKDRNRTQATDNYPRSPPGQVGAPPLQSFAMCSGNPHPATSILIPSGSAIVHANFESGLGLRPRRFSSASTFVWS